MTSLLKQRLSIAPGLLTRQVADQIILVDPRNDSSFALDVVGTRIWSLIQDCGEVEAILDKIQREYPVSVPRLESDLEAFLQQLTEAKLIAVTAAGD